MSERKDRNVESALETTPHILYVDHFLNDTKTRACLSTVSVRQDFEMLPIVSI